MPESNNPLLDSLNLLFFLLVIKHNPHLLSNPTQNSDLHNSLLKTKQSFKQKEKLEKHNFRDELYIHAKNVDYLQIKVMGEGPKSLITGYLGKLYKDFITLVEKGEKINIPINKISTLRIIDFDDNIDHLDHIKKSNEQFNNEKRHTQKTRQLQLPF